MGDPAGIGGDITLAAWTLHRQGKAALPPFAVIDDPARLTALAARLGLEVPIAPLENLAQAPGLFAQALPVLPHPLPQAVEPGQPNPATAPAVIAAIERAVALVQQGQAGAVVTNPIAKHVLHAAGFPFPGHTEFLAHLAGEGVQPVMMLACPALRVVPITIHVSLRQAIASLTTEKIVSTARITAAALRRDFGLEHPRLAFTGLNPHAGEQGAMGDEEDTLIRPALEILRADGLAVSGPHPADTLFHAEARTTYDVALCMYHDQALIPLKTLDFHGGVNVTLGLPFRRTSPDHGTAFALAGTGRANPSSLIAALRLAAESGERRP